MRFERETPSYGFDVEFEMPVIVELGPKDAINTRYDFPAMVTIEPDEHTGDDDWYIASVYVEGQRNGGSTQWHELPSGHAMHEAIKSYAYQQMKQVIEGRWSDYCADRPREGSRSVA